MWLDRFSGNNTPSGSPPPSQNRSYSPAPRRSSHLVPGASVRPNYTSRSSSTYLGGKSNASTTSLSSTKVSHGSTLKQQITPPADVVDPLEVLAAVVGRPLPEEKLENWSTQDGVEYEKPIRLVEDVEFNGLSLKEFALADFSDKEESEVHSATTVQTVEECEYVCTLGRMINISLNLALDEKEKDKFEDLHRSILVLDTLSFCISL